MPEFLKNQPLLFWLAVLFAGVACAAVFLYFRALRPRPGTTEWIRRVDPPHYAPPAVQELGWADAVWALLAVLFAGVLRSFALFFGNRLYRSADLQRVLNENLRRFAGELFFYAILAAAVYLLLRAMFGKPFPALLCAGIGGILPGPAPEVTALLACSLLCLYVWLAVRGSVAQDVLWLVLCGLTYGAALLFCRAAAWYAPFFLGAYVFAQVLHWRQGAPERRAKRLVGSLLLTLLLLPVWIVALWLAHEMLSGAVSDPIAALGAREFYASLSSALPEKAAGLFRDFPLFGAPEPLKLHRVAVCLLAAIPLLHGALRLRESRCLFALLLLPCALCAWLLGGVALVTAPVLLALGWTWYVFQERGRPARAVFCACAVALYYGAELILL